MGELQLISDLRGEDAQTFIDVIHEVRFHTPSFLRSSLITFVLGYLPFKLPPFINQALGLPGLSPRLWRKCLAALCKICGRQGLLPKSLQIPLCYNRLDEPLYHGGYADVWKGERQGRPVAVKVLRVYSTDDFDKITKVCSHIPLKPCADQLVLAIAEVLQGGCDLDDSSSSKRTTTVRCDNGRTPLYNGFGVDGKW